MRYFPMADSQLILELMSLHIRGGCSLTVLLFFLMLVGTASGHIFRLTFRSLSDVLYSDECRMKNAFSMSK